MTTDIDARKPSDAGFTMLDLLVSLALMSMVVAAVPGLVRMVGKSVQIAGELTRAQADLAALDAITDKLSEARPLAVRQTDGRRHMQFWGTEHEVRFVAPGFAGGSGGLLTYNIGISPTRAGSSALAVTRSPFMLDASEQPTTGDTRRPMPATRRLTFRYFGPRGDDGTAGWSNTWDRDDALPQLIEVQTGSAWRWLPQFRSVVVPLRLYQLPPPRTSP